MSEIKWSPTQLEIIESKNKNMLVSAGAGAGKTAVLVEKIIRRVMDNEDPLNINEIMVVTFTEKAALEMKERISTELTKALIKNPNNKRLKAQLQLLNKANISTLHSFCSELLRKYFYWLDLEPDFRIANEHEIDLMKDELLESYLEELYQIEDKDFFGLVDLYGGNMDDSKLKQHILLLHEFSKSTPSPEDWLSKIKGYFNLEAETSLETLEFYGEAIEILRESIEKNKGLLEEAIEKSDLPGGPWVYRERLEEEYGALEIVEKKIDEGIDWETLREHWRKINFKRLPSIKKEQEVDEELKEEVKELRNKVKEEISSYAEGLLSRSSKDLIEELKDTAPYMKKLIDLVEEFENRFSGAKKQKKLLDYSDLEHEVLKLFRYEEVISELKEEYKEVMVDEYQDINRVQNKILESISDSRIDDYPYMFMVGDVKQSIYRFRLAEPELFIDRYYSFRKYHLAENYPDGGLEKGNKNNNKIKKSEKLVELQENFRSAKKVIDGVNEIFRNVMTRKLGGIDYNEDTEIKPVKEFPLPGSKEFSVKSYNAGDCYLEDKILAKKPGEILYVTDENSEEFFTTEEKEASIIADRIKELVEEGYLVYDEEEKSYRAVEYRDVVILNRQLQTHGEKISEIFTSRGIPFYAELNKGYFKAPEVQVMLSLLKIIDNPRQDIHLAAVLRSPIVNLSERELFRICNKNRECTRYLDLYDIIAEVSGVYGECYQEEMKDNEYEEIDKVKDFLAKLNRWRTFSRKNRLSELIWDIYEVTGYLDFVRGLVDGEERKANLYSLYDRALQFDSFSQSGLFRFLRFIEKLEDRREDLASARVLSEKDNVVRLMSIHKSKGLEFPLVFVMGLGKKFNTKEIEKDLLIHKEFGLGPKKIELDKKIKYPTISYELIREKIYRELISEELRILYVALTRAEEHFVLIGSGKGVDYHRIENSKCFFDWIIPSVKESSLFEICEGVEKEIEREGAFEEEAGIELQEEDKLGSEVSSGSNIIDDLVNDNVACESNVVNYQGEKASHYNKIKELLDWEYSYKNVIDYPAKLTVTKIQKEKLKPGTGRIEKEESKDKMKEKAELDDVTKTPKSTSKTAASEMSSFRRPLFVEKEEELTGAEIGTIYHLVFEHISLDELASGESYGAKLEKIRENLLILKDKEVLTEEQMKLIDENKIADFFETSLGKRILQNRRNLSRELNFTMGLLPGDIGVFVETENFQTLREKDQKEKDEKSSKDKIVVQGAIDYLLSEEDGAVIVDLKTDNVKKDALKTLQEKYKIQLKYYKAAVEKIHKEKVKEVYLYHVFHNEAIECEI